MMRTVAMYSYAMYSYIVSLIRASARRWSSANACSGPLAYCVVGYVRRVRQLLHRDDHAFGCALAAGDQRRADDPDLDALSLPVGCREHDFLGLRLGRRQGGA